MNSASELYGFGDFRLDPAERRLERDGESVSLSGRYLDALLLMVREQGHLVTKDRLHEEVWQGIPVTDEAITQCVRSLRRALGDDASNPRFIETVPKHGYRFIAPVTSPGRAGTAAPAGETNADLSAADTPRNAAPPAANSPAAHSPAAAALRERIVRIGLAGIAGGAVAGLVGGLFYGFVIAFDGPTGGTSTVLVMACITVLVAALGATGVALGIAVGHSTASGGAIRTVAGGALGGALIGGFVKLVGVDALALVFGTSPRGITGGLEGLAVGGAIGLGAALALRPRTSLRAGTALAALIGGAAGAGVTLLGGRMMGGSLALLAESAPNSRLDLSSLGMLAGEGRFGPAAQIVCGGLEGALFGACIVAAMQMAAAHAPKRPEAHGSGAFPYPS